MKKNLLFLILLLSGTLVFPMGKQTGDKINASGGVSIKLRHVLPDLQKKAIEAYKSFNKYLFDPRRKLYYRDTDQSEKLAAIWTQAIYWDMAMNAYKLTKDQQYRQLIDDIYQGGAAEYDHYNWENHKEWFIWDDMMWWIISLARAYEVTGEQKYLDHSMKGFRHVWEGSYDPDEGGMDWWWKQEGKTACINYPTVIASMTLFRITQDPVYLEKAKKIYDWAFTNLFDPSEGKVADHKVGKNPASGKIHVYNQGTCIGAAVMLFQETGENHYLRDAVLAANYVKNVMCRPDGIIPGEGDDSPDNEQGIYTAIFAQYIIRLIEDGNKPEYIPWLKRNIETAWSKRDAANGLTWKHYTEKCPSGKAVSSYDASGIPALMLVCPAENYQK